MSAMNLSSRPGTSQHMSPARCLPTGLANLERTETMPEIQMPSMAAFDPNSAASKDQSYFTSNYSYAKELTVDIQSAITDDIVQIYTGVQHCLDLRRKYIKISLQRSSDNPKNNVERWRIYPEPPPPRWLFNAECGAWEDHKHDYPKLGVGEDFNFEDCEIPGSDKKVYRLENGVYQVYPDDNGFFPWKQR